MSNNSDKRSGQMNSPQSYEDEIDLSELFTVIWKGKWLIISMTALFSVIAVIYALNQPNFYSSEVLLAPAEEEKSLGGLQGQFGGLASLAGINIGGSSSNNTQLAIQILKSRRFTYDFIEKHNILADLMAVKAWNIKNNTITYDESLYIMEDDKWVREVVFPLQSKPSMQEAYKKFSQALNIVTDGDTGMVILSVKHLSPFIAKQWVDWLVEDINSTMKTRDVYEAEKSTAFLSAQIADTKLTDIREVLYRLIESQAKTIMFANVRDEYVFKTIDPAEIPERKAGPKRALICVLGAIIGGILGLMSIFLRYFFKK